MKPHRGLVGTIVRRDERPHQGRRFERAAEGRRFASIGMPSTPAPNIRNGTGAICRTAATRSFSTNLHWRAGHDYFRLGGHAVSPDGRLLAYAVDTDGSERFVLKVRDLATGIDLAGRDRELALRPDLGRGFKELSLYRRRRELAFEGGVASPARRSASRGPRNLSRARSEIRCQPRPHPVAALCHLYHRRPRDQ